MPGCTRSAAATARRRRRSSRSTSGDGTTIEYRAALDVKAPLPGFILRRVTDGLVAASLPNMFASIEREVRKRQAPQT